MVRKVGFGQTEKKSKPSVADRYVEEFRAKSRHQKTNEAAAAKTPLMARIAIVTFLLIWLTGWTAGVITVAVILISDGFDIFLIIWEILAIGGWIIAVFALIQTIKGKTIVSKKRS